MILVHTSSTGVFVVCAQDICFDLHLTFFFFFFVDK
jgi:hypothetical protein